MEVLKINDNKIKIMLSERDMRDFKLDSSELDYNDPVTRGKVFRVLEYVKRNYGFDHEGDKLLIQFYPSKDGGAELFVTKLGILNPQERKAVSRSDRVAMLTAKRSMYAFSSFSDLLAASKALSRNADVRESGLYLFENGTYYLELTERGDGRGDTVKEYAAVLEFATAVTLDKLPYITEHSECLAEKNAVEILASLA